MANAQTTIDLIFNGVDKTGAATLAALDNAKKFTGSLQNATQPIADFTVGAVKLEAGLLAAGLAMTVFAVKTAGDFEQSFAQISTLFDASDEDLAKFKDQIKDYAAASGKSMEDVMGSLKAAIGQGVNYTDSLKLMAVAEKLSIASRSDMKSTTEVLVGTMNAYGIATKDAGTVADVMFQIIKDGKVEMSDLSASMANVNAIAPQAGVSLIDVGAAIATLTATSMQPSTAIDALKSVISNIIKPSEQAKKTAEELGIEFNATALKSKGLAAVLDNVAKATGGSTEKLALLFGDVTGLGAVMLLTGTQADNFGKTIASMGNSAGSVAGAYEKMAGSMDVVMRKITNAFTGLMVTIGTPLLDEFGGIAAAITKIFASIGVSVKEGGLKDVADYIETLMKGLKGSVEKVAENLPAALAKADFSGFKGGIEAVVGAFGRLFANIDLSTVDGLTRAIELAGAAFLGLSKFTGGVIEGFKPLFEKLVEIAGKVGGLNPEWIEMAGNIGGVAIQVTAFADALGGLSSWLSAIVGLMIANQGLNLVAGVGALTGSIPLLTASVGLWTAGIAAGAAGIGLIVYALNDWIKAEALKNAAFATTVKLTGETTDRLKEFAATTGITAQSLDQVFRLLKDGVVVWDAASKSYKKAGDTLLGAGTAASTAQSDFRKSEITLQNSAAAAEKAAGATGKLGTAQKDLSTYALKTVPVFDSLTGKITGYEQQLVKTEGGTIKLGKASDAAGKDLAKIAAETEKASEATRKWNQEVAKMAFEEKIRLIDQQTKVMTANVEADTKKTVAAFDALTGSIKSTGEVLGKLFTNLDFSKVGWTEQRLIEKQIDIENKHRSDSFDLQKRLTEATITQMNAQANALIKGDGLIKISGDGLKPHLEAFMWEILQTIQVRVNADGLKMLLGT